MFHNDLMPSEEATELVHSVIDLLREKRLNGFARVSEQPESSKPMPLRHLAKISNLDAGALSRAEAKERIPSFAFFVDWANALDCTLEEIVSEARNKQT